MEAIKGILLLQVPLPLASIKVVLPPVHTAVAPVIAAGTGFTVMATVCAVAVALYVVHELTAVRV
jgi:hypothetical protein